MRAFMERTAPLNNVARMKVPLLVVQGPMIRGRPLSETEQMVKRAQANGGTCWYLMAATRAMASPRNAMRTSSSSPQSSFSRSFCSTDRGLLLLAIQHHFTLRLLPGIRLYPAREARGP